MVGNWMWLNVLKLNLDKNRESLGLEIRDAGGWPSLGIGFHSLCRSSYTTLGYCWIIRWPALVGAPVVAIPESVGSGHSGSFLGEIMWGCPWSWSEICNQCRMWWLRLPQQFCVAVYRWPSVFPGIQSQDSQDCQNALMFEFADLAPFEHPNVTRVVIWLCLGFVLRPAEAMRSLCGLQNEL